MKQVHYKFHKHTQIKKQPKKLSKEQEKELFDTSVDIEVLDAIMNHSKKAKELRFRLQTSIIKDDVIRYDIIKAEIAEIDFQLQELTEVWGK